jgi:hypothetical protein
VADGKPGAECQVDFGKMGLLDDPASNRRRTVQALIFTAVYSRHMFVWLSFSQTLQAVAPPTSPARTALLEGAESGGLGRDPSSASGGGCADQGDRSAAWGGSEHGAGGVGVGSAADVSAGVAWVGG